MYANDINILGGNVFNKEKNTKALVVSSKEDGLEVNYDKTKYIVNFLDVTEEVVTIMKTRSLERVEDFKYLGNHLTNQNYIQKKLNVS